MVLILKVLKYSGFVILFLSSQLSIAQSCEKKIDLAKRYYQEGLLDTIVQFQLNDCSNDEKLELLHLQAEAYAALSKLNKAKQLIGQILSINRRYKPKITDSKRLKRLYQVIKRQNNKEITYAISKSADSLTLSAANITIISQQEIEQRGYQSLAEIFQDIAGFSNINSAGNNIIYNRGIRNVKKTEGMLILVDGLEYNNIWSQTIPLDDRFSIANIDKIEILNGPQSTFYGANALTTVINIVTKKASSILPYQEKSGLIAQVTKQFNPSNPILDGFLAADLAFMIDLGNESILTLNGKYAYNNQKNKVNFDYAPKDLEVYHIVYDNELHDTILQNLRELDIAAYNNSIIFDTITKPNTYASFSSTLDIENFKLTMNFQEIKNETTSLFADRRNFGILNSTYHDQIGGFSLQFNKFVANNFYINTNSSYRLENSTAYNNRLLSYQIGNLINGINSNNSANSVQPFIQDQTYTQQSQEFRTEINIEYSGKSWIDLIAGIDFRSNILQANYQIERSKAKDNGYHFFNNKFRSQNYFFQQNNNYNLASFFGTNINHKAIPNLYISLGVRYEGYSKITSNYHFGDDNYYDFFMNFYNNYYISNPEKNRQFVAISDTVNNNIVFDSNAYSDSINGTQYQLSPKLVLVYNLFKSDNKNLIFKLLYNKGFQTVAQSTRFGTTTDLIFNNPFISRPTIAENRELNLNYTTKKWHIATTYFNTTYKNVLTTRFHSTSFANQSDVDHSLLGIYNTDYTRFDSIPILVYDYEDVNAQGFQVDIKGKFNVGKNSDLSIFANYAYSKSTNKVDKKEQEIPGIANHQFNLGLNLLTLEKRLNINLRMNYVGDRSINPEAYAGFLSSSPKVNIPAYVVFHGAVTYYFPRQHLGFQLVVRNIFDKDYYHPGIGAADRFYYKSRIKQPLHQILLKALFDLNRFDVFHRLEF